MAGGRGRPVSEEKRKAIIEAGLRTFLDNGFSGTSMDTVAAVAGVSKQTVYAHFGSKESLFQAVVSQKCADYRFAETEVDDHVDIKVALARTIRRFLDLLFDPDTIALERLLIAHSLSHPRIVQVYYEAGPERVVKTLSRFLEMRAAQGELVVEDPHEVAFDILSEAAPRMREELMLGLRTEVTEEERDARVAYVVRSILTMRGCQPVAAAAVGR